MTAKTDEEPQVSDEEREPAEDHEDEDEHGHDGVTLAGLADKVDRLADTVARFAKGGTGRKPTAADSADEVAGQVRAEVEKITKAEAARKGREDRIGQLEAQVQKIAEAPPREYRRLTRILWGEDE